MRHVIVLQDQLQLKETDRQKDNQSENLTERNSQKDDVYARIILCLHVDVGIHL